MSTPPLLFEAYVQGNNMPKRSAAAREPFVAERSVATARKEQLIRQDGAARTAAHRG